MWIAISVEGDGAVLSRVTAVDGRRVPAVSILIGVHEVSDCVVVADMRIALRIEGKGAVLPYVTCALDGRDIPRARAGLSGDVHRGDE